MGKHFRMETVMVVMRASDRSVWPWTEIVVRRFLLLLLGQSTGFSTQRRHPIRAFPCGLYSSMSSVLPFEFPLDPVIDLVSSRERFSHTRLLSKLKRSSRSDNLRSDSSVDSLGLSQSFELTCKSSIRLKAIATATGIAEQILIGTRQ
jgi:hypothetical protein